MDFDRRCKAKRPFDDFRGVKLLLSLSATPHGLGGKMNGLLSEKILRRFYDIFPRNCSQLNEKMGCFSRDLY